MISSAHGLSPIGDSSQSTELENASLPPLLLEVCSGQTRFPIRPVTSRRFLIGSGEGCDLRLGGDDMPPLHSIVHVDHVEVLLETVAQSPPLKVNGLLVESVLLQDGDKIEIGSLEFMAHRPPDDFIAQPGTAQTNHLVFDLDAEDGEELDPSRLSAAELVELIEEEEAEVELFEQRQQLGVEALLDSVAERIEQAELVPFSGEHPHELERLLEQATRLAEELKHRTDMLAEREAAQVHVTESVFESQQELALRLESLVSRIATIEDRQQPRYPKVA